MKIQDVLKGYAVMLHCVPLSTSEIGFAYLNNCDTGIWVVTFNYKHSLVSQDGVTITQLQQVFTQYSRYADGMQNTFEKELKNILEILHQHDAEQIIQFS